MLGKNNDIFQLTKDSETSEIITSEVSIFNYYNYYIDTEKFIYGLIPFEGATVIKYTNAHYLSSLLPNKEDYLNTEFNKAEGSFRTLRKTDLNIFF